MPGPLIHISVMRDVAKKLAAEGYTPQRSERIDPKWVGADPKALGKLMQSHSNFAALGAIGPDLFFFLPDFRDTSLGPVYQPDAALVLAQVYTPTDELPQDVLSKPIQ